MRRSLQPWPDSGYYFCFGGLTIRCVGEYRFKFVMIDFDAGEQGPLKLGSIFSEPFKVYTPASYPGVLESTRFPIPRVLHYTQDITGFP